MSLDFQGNQHTPGTDAYNPANDLYATSTYGTKRNMNPGEILQPTTVEDIQNVVKYANSVGKPIAIKRQVSRRQSGLVLNVSRLYILENQADLALALLQWRPTI